MLIAFIPHATLSEFLNVTPKETLFRIKQVTEADKAEYHRGNQGQKCCKGVVYHVVLTNPTISIEDINEEMVNSFAQDSPIWRVW